MALVGWVYWGQPYWAGVVCLKLVGRGVCRYNYIVYVVYM